MTAVAVAAEDVPSGYSDVYVDGTRLMVRKRQPDGTLGQAAPWTIWGATWAPATRVPFMGPNPLNPIEQVQYGFFFDWPGRNPQGHVVMNHWTRSQFAVHYQADLALMAQMNATTLRTYDDIANDAATGLAILDECYRRGIMVILTVAPGRTDIDDGRHLQIVNRYKDHPAVLMWLLGNEWNFNLYYGYASATEAAAATQAAALQVKAADPHHPVSSSLGDAFDLPPACNPATDPCCGGGTPDPAVTVPSIVASVPAVDIWGLNVYRASGLPGIFPQWTAITAKPFYFGEFGTDSFRTDSSQPLAACSSLIKNVTGAVDEPMQANYILQELNAMTPHLSAADAAKPLAGGLVHTFNDQLWQVGNYNLGLGGLVNYDGPDNLPNTADDDSSYDDYNTEGHVFWSFTDTKANPEHFGIVNADRNPKQAFSVLQNHFLTTPPRLTLRNPQMAQPFIQLDGAAVNAQVVIENLTAQPMDGIMLQTWVEQQGARRAGDGESVSACSQTPGRVPPGVCTHGFAVRARNYTSGYGTLIHNAPGQVIIELHAGDGTVLSSVSMPTYVCHVLTAAFGRADHPVILSLWQKHQRWVGGQWQAPWHQAYMRWYDRKGPQIAEQVRRRPWLQRLIRQAAQAAAGYRTPQAGQKP